MKILTALLSLLLLFAFSYGQTPPEEKTHLRTVFSSFHSSLASLTKKFSDKSSRGMKGDIANSLERISENVKFLDAVTNSNESIPKEYLEGLSLDAELLESLVERKTTTRSGLKKLLDGLKEVDSNLALKVAGPRGGGEIVRVVEVLVHAKKGNKHVEAYQVWYVPRGWAKDPSRAKPFDKLTNADPNKPSSMKVAPGNYFIWLTKGRPVTPRQAANVGVNGETRREIELPVP